MVRSVVGPVRKWMTQLCCDLLAVRLQLLQTRYLQEATHSKGQLTSSARSTTLALRSRPLTPPEMRTYVWLVIVAGTLEICVAAPKEGTACVKNGMTCKDNNECCGGCCQQGHCVPYSDACVAAASPCHLYDCVPPKVCYLQQVQCLQSPCKPIPACRAPDSDYD